AVAVALGIVPFALGSDTGGSIRQPASFCGVVGLKPTYGSVSRYGVVAMASSTDVVGPITQTAEDAGLVLSCMAGKDDRDSTTLANFFEPTTLSEPLKIGVIEDYMGDGVDESVKSAVTASIEALKAKGHTVESVSLPTVKYALAVYYIVVPAEVSSNLARYDGIKYGVRADNAASLSEVYEKSRSEGFMDENKRRILIGNYVLSSGYYDAYYHKAQSVRTLIINEFNTAFDSYDVLIGPVTPTTAFKLGQNTHDPLSMYLADIMTVPPSLAGLPAISVPIATDADGMPIGLQIISRMRDDATVLALASQLEHNNG
ncbi:Asp-tRNA(Asn)/Glu-tRNA(Gln) amidotransferase subunit GatA, partial [Pedobacter sp.]|nr:Asp-tRNA(Asn)/Glu-tRNA(Gln) amidotransferase subunit GatA [Candidatus Saccharibacteria bacterium]